MAKTEKKKSRRFTKICNKCGTENPLNAQKCNACDATNFAPAWVKAKCFINKQVSVEITESNPKFGDTKSRITLSKWWPGGNSTFHIPNIFQWNEIESIINNQLAPLLKWKKKEQLISEITSKEVSQKTQKKQYQSLIESHPDFLKKLVSSIDLTRISTKDFNALIETFGEISDALTNANAGFREAFLGVVKKLPKQKQRALEDLELLLQGWSLHVITNVEQQVRARIETIELFAKQVENPKTFEIMGDKSIHRILERAMWMIDERYWLLHSNSTLRKFIGDEMSKRDEKKYGKKETRFRVWNRRQ